MENTFIQLIFLAYHPSVKLFAYNLYIQIYLHIINLHIIAIKATENWIKFGFFVLFSGLAVNNRQ